MPLFYFVLKTDREKIPDREGLEFPDETVARAHAAIVVQELMRNREVRTHHWRLEALDENLHPSFELLFAAMDPSVAHHGPEYRASVEGLARSRASLSDVYQKVQASVADIRETLERAERFMRQTGIQRSNGGGPSPSQT